MSKNNNNMLIEILDTKGKPIGAMPYNSVHYKQFIHRKVLVVPYITLSKICLINIKQYSNRIWDLPVNTHIPAGRSREEIALKNLKYNLGLNIYPLKSIEEFYWEEEKEFLYIYIGRCTNRAIISKNPKIEHIEFFNLKDLEFLISKYPSNFSRELYFLIQQKIIQGLNKNITINELRPS